MTAEITVGELLEHAELGVKVVAGMAGLTRTWWGSRCRS
jgi:hypothetical protein